MRTIADIGFYECEWQLVNTAWIRPQNRERVFFVGHLRGKSRPEVFPITKNDRLFIPAPGKTTHVFQAITATDYKGLSKQRSNCVAIHVLTPERKEKRQNGRRFKEDGEPMFTLNCQDRHGIFDGHKLRRITPLESERLQGFPDGWTMYGNYDGEIKSISDNQRYKQLGNAVTTDMPRMIAERLSIFGDSQKAGGAFFIPSNTQKVE